MVNTSSESELYNILSSPEACPPPALLKKLYFAVVRSSSYVSGRLNLVNIPVINKFIYQTLALT